MTDIEDVAVVVGLLALAGAAMNKTGEGSSGSVGYVAPVTTKVPRFNAAARPTVTSWSASSVPIAPTAITQEQVDTVNDLVTTGAITGINNAPAPVITTESVVNVQTNVNSGVLQGVQSGNIILPTGSSINYVTAQIYFLPDGENSNVSLGPGSMLYNPLAALYVYMDYQGNTWYTQTLPSYAKQLASSAEYGPGYYAIALTQAADWNAILAAQGAQVPSSPVSS